MAGLVERSDSRRYQLEQRRHKRAVILISFICILTAILTFAYIINSFINKRYDGYEVLHTTARADSNTVKYESYNGKLLKYSRDGASALDPDGTVIWNGSYDMKNPVATSCGDYVAIADIGGKEAYVFTGSDSGTKIETILPIVEIEVGNQGLLVLVLEDHDANVITYYAPYDNTQAIKVEVPTNVDTDGYPVDIAISSDGHSLVTSYINIQSGEIESSVNFYNFNELGDNKINNLVGGYKFSKLVIAKTEFLNDNTVVAYGENMFQVYTNAQLPQEKFSGTFEEPIKSIFYNENYLGFVLESKDKENNYRVIVYNLSGKTVLDKQIDYKYDQVFLSGKEIVFYTDRECSILRMTGKEKFHYTFDENIEYFMPVNNKENYVIINSSNIEEIKLTEE